jgi:hypothetical protein
MNIIHFLCNWSIPGLYFGYGRQAGTSASLNDGPYDPRSEIGSQIDQSCPPNVGMPHIDIKDKRNSGRERYIMSDIWSSAFVGSFSALHDKWRGDFEASCKKQKARYINVFLGRQCHPGNWSDRKKDMSHLLRCDHGLWERNRAAYAAVCYTAAAAFLSDHGIQLSHTGLRGYSFSSSSSSSSPCSDISSLYPCFPYV